MGPALTLPPWPRHRLKLALIGALLGAAVSALVPAFTDVVDASGAASSRPVAEVG